MFDGLRATGQQASGLEMGQDSRDRAGVGVEAQGQGRGGEQRPRDEDRAPLGTQFWT